MLSAENPLYHFAVRAELVGRREGSNYILGNDWSPLLELACGASDLKRDVV